MRTQVSYLIVGILWANFAGQVANTPSGGGFNSLLPESRRGQDSPEQTRSVGRDQRQGKLGSFSDIFGGLRQSTTKEKTSLPTVSSITTPSSHPSRLSHHPFHQEIRSRRLGAASTLQNTKVKAPKLSHVRAGNAISWPFDGPENPQQNAIPHSFLELAKKFPSSLKTVSDDVRATDGDSANYMSVLDVHHPNSPYGLIQDVLPSKKYPPAVNSQSPDFAQGVDPSEVWLSDGDLLVLKGGTTSLQDGFDSPWEPLDDYQAPYREPVLAPENILETHKGQFSGIAMFYPSTPQANDESIVGRTPRLGTFLPEAPSSPVRSNFNFPQHSASPAVPIRHTLQPSTSIFGGLSPTASLSGGSSPSTSISGGWIPSSPEWNRFLRGSTESNSASLPSTSTPVWTRPSNSVGGNYPNTFLYQNVPSAGSTIHAPPLGPNRQVRLHRTQLALGNGGPIGPSYNNVQSTFDPVRSVRAEFSSASAGPGVVSWASNLGLRIRNSHHQAQSITRPIQTPSRVLNARYIRPPGISLGGIQFLQRPHKRRNSHQG